MLSDSGIVRASSLAVAIVLALAPVRAARADDDPRGAARVHYARGLDLGSQGDYGAALQEFHDAYTLSPHFAVLYNIGQAQVALGRPLAAVETLSKYLTDGGDGVPPDRRKQVEAQILLLESLFARLEVTTDPAGAVVSIDGREIGRTPLAEPVRVPAGTHEVSAAFEGLPAVKRSITLREGDAEVLKLARAPTPAPSTPSGSGANATSDVPPPKRSTARGLQRSEGFEAKFLVPDERRRSDEKRGSASFLKDVPTWLWIAGGSVLVAGAITGGYFLFKPSERQGSSTPGSIATVELPLW